MRHPKRVIHMTVRFSRKTLFNKSGLNLVPDNTRKKLSKLNELNSTITQTLSHITRSRKLNPLEPQNMGVPFNQIPEISFGKDSSNRRKGLSAKEYFLLAVSTLVALGVFAGLITLAIFLVQNKEGSTATTTSRSSLSTTVTTTTTTVLATVTSTQDYTIELAASGYHGVQKVRYYAATNTGSAMRFDYPIVYLSGTTFSGTYVNNAWYALHAGCGNGNGIATCTAVCKALGKSYINMTTTCGNGYAGSVTNYTNPNRCVYTGSDTTSAPWVDYGTASACGNSMSFCTCSL